AAERAVEVVRRAVRGGRARALVEAPVTQESRLVAGQRAAHVALDLDAAARPGPQAHLVDAAGVIAVPAPVAAADVVQGAVEVAGPRGRPGGDEGAVLVQRPRPGWIEDRREVLPLVQLDDVAGGDLAAGDAAAVHLEGEVVGRA